jgi:hypothetical protein
VRVFARTPFATLDADAVSRVGNRIAFAAVGVAVAALSLAGSALPHTLAANSIVARPVAAPGSYSGQNGQNGFGITFYVAPGGRSILNISDASTTLACTPGGSALADHLVILAAAVKPDGSFTAKGTQEGVVAAVAGDKATFRYTFAGRFQAATATKAASAAGTWREDVVLAGGTIKLCTSNRQSWTATRNAVPAQPTTVVKPGSYSGQNGQNGLGITFSVAPGGKSIENISDTATALACTPGGSTLADHLTIPKAAIRPGGSFNVTASQTGVVAALAGNSAKFIYTFAGHFEGPTPTGAATVAGKWREDVVLAGGATKLCTSDDQFWTATRS